jgi:hypothetical protein
MVLQFTILGAKTPAIAGVFEDGLGVWPYFIGSIMISSCSIEM